MQDKLKDTKTLIWKDRFRDEGADIKNKSQHLIELAESFNLMIVNQYDFMPMVVIRGSDEQLKLLEETGDVIIEDNGPIYASGNNTPPGFMPNCS